MNRRNFIRASLSALVGAALIPRIPLALPSEPLTATGARIMAENVPRWVGTSAGSMGKITYEALERAYREARVAQMELAPIIVSKSQYKYYARLLGVYEKET